jgi:DNA-binding response OmpR family regulator
MSRVLLVSDDQPYSLELTKELQNYGHLVVCCTGWQSASQIIRQHYDDPFDIVILDARRNAWKAVRWLRNLNHFSRMSGQSLFAICIATPYFDPPLELEIERCGARVVYEH